MQVFPTAPSPTVTHLMNLEALDAIAKDSQHMPERRTVRLRDFFPFLFLKGILKDHMFLTTTVAAFVGRQRD